MKRFTFCLLILAAGCVQSVPATVDQPKPKTETPAPVVVAVQPRKSVVAETPKPVQSTAEIEFETARRVFDTFSQLTQLAKMEQTYLQLKGLLGKPSKITFNVAHDGSFSATWGPHVGKLDGGKPRKSDVLLARFTPAGHISLWILRKPSLKDGCITDKVHEHFTLLGEEWFDITVRD